MFAARLIPKKFSSRLFLVAFIAGLIPIVIFSVLIASYGHRVEEAITGVIREAFSQDISQTDYILREMGESTVRSEAVETARQIDMVIESVPWMTLEDLQRDPHFRALAVQAIGNTGNTFVFETHSSIMRLHEDQRFENKDVLRTFSDLPNFGAIIRASQGPQGVARGYYTCRTKDGKIVHKFLYIVPLHSTAADGAPLSLAATINADDFLSPMRRSQAIHNTTRKHLVDASTSVAQSFRHTGLVYMGIGILIVSLLASVMGVFLSRSITSLREATARINGGDFSVIVDSRASGEMGALIHDFSKMVDQLASTAVSKQLLEASEARLTEANIELQREIRERERTEEALAAEKDRLHITLRSIGDGVITSNREGKVVMVNNAAETLTGWKQDEAAGRSFSEVFHIEDKGSWEVASEGNNPDKGRHELKNPLRRKVLTARDGTERIIAETRSAIRNRQGIELGKVIVFRDITLQEKMEEELLKARKIESLAVLAGGIAHDFNNLLAVILGNISFAKMLIGGESKASAKLSDAEKACMRVKDLTYQLLVFAQEKEPFRTTKAIAGITETAVHRGLVDSGVEPLFFFGRYLPAVEMDEKQIGQVVERMVRNASEAMNKRGTLRVCTDAVTVNGDHALPLKKGNYVRICLRDEGPGIAEEDLQRIFDPYFSKKEMGVRKGQGLGLSICYAIIKGHGGLISVESGPGAGTMFSIYLPASQDRQGEESPAIEALPGRGRLLLVDNNRPRGKLSEVS